MIINIVPIILNKTIKFLCEIKTKIVCVLFFLQNYNCLQQPYFSDKTFSWSYCLPLYNISDFNTGIMEKNSTLRSRGKSTDLLEKTKLDFIADNHKSYEIKDAIILRDCVLFSKRSSESDHQGYFENICSPLARLVYITQSICRNHWNTEVITRIIKDPNV